MNAQQYLDLKPPKWLEMEMTTFRFKKLVSIYNQMRLKNDSMKLTDKQWFELALIYRPKLAKERPVIATKKTVSLMKNEQVRIYADSLLGEALTNNEIDVDFVIKNRKDILKNAIETKQLNTANQTLDVIEDYIGMKRIITQSSNTESDEAREVDYIKLDEEVSDVKGKQKDKQKILEPPSENTELPPK